MKKLSFLLLTGLAVLNGCTSEEDPIPQFETAEGATETTYTRSVADAIALADAFLDAGNDKVESRAGRTPKVAAILGATSRSESDTLLYSVNYGEDDGFVIVSATATPQPVLAYVEKGSYDGEPTQNPGFEAFIDAAKSYSSHETDTLTEITAMRSNVDRTSDVSEVEKDDALFQQALTQVNVVAENYPDLKADRVYSQAMQGVDKYENNVRQARMVFNDTVTKYNRQVQQFPSSIVAGIFGFSQEEYFKNTESKSDMPQW